MSRRRTSPALAAPQTLPEAIKLLERYARLANEAARLDVDRNDAKAAIDAAADAAIAPIEAELRDLVRQLKPWWAVARDELTGGKKKSIELAGCQIGYRIANPSLVYPKPEAVAVEKLHLREGWALRTTTVLDKPALIAAIRRPPVDEDDDTAARLRKLGFSVSQKETFFVDVAPPKPVTESVADAEEDAS